jgi:DNA-binding HxlR family transcriptional regulator
VVSPTTIPDSGTNSAQRRECSVAGALEVIGEKWSLLVVRELLFGVDTFNEIATKTGAPRDILTTRLRRLEELGVIERHVYSERPLRHRYALTPKGKDLRPVMMTLKHWGDTHVMGQVMPPIYQHTCGAVFQPRIECMACEETIHPRSLTRTDNLS